MKHYYIADLQEGAKIEDVFLINSKIVGNTRAGAPFLKLRLGDRTGTVDAVKWTVTEADLAGVNELDYVLVHGTVKQYNGDPQVAIDSMRKWGQEVDPSDFLAVSPHDPDEMFSELNGILNQVQNPQLQKLLALFFDDENTAAKFRQAPAAAKLHHACIGGLLEHTLNVVRTSSALADLYPNADKDILITAAALHDIGKLEEFDWSVVIKYSDSGHMVGHVVGGAMMVKEAARKIDDFDPLLNLALQHAILAHHGNKEWGSPKRPKSIEALILHYADDLDAKIAMFQSAIDDSDRNGDNGLFTPRHFNLDRPIFKGIPQLSSQAENEPQAAESFNGDLFAADSDWDPFSEE